MPKIYPEAYTQADVIVAPEEINREVASVLGVFNGGMDRDNITQRRVTAAMCESTTFHEMKVLEQTAASQIIGLVPGHQPGQWDHLLDAAGDPWIKHITTEESVLDISIGCEIAQATFPANAYLGIRVDGALITTTGLWGYHDRASRVLEGTAVVGAGGHVVEALIMYAWTAPGGTSNVTMLGRHFWVREVRR